jgi:hypothetical protein
MKKTLTILTLVLTVSFLAGCGKKAVENQNQNQNQTTVANGNNGNSGENGKLETAINTVKDAISSGKKMKCTYTMDINGQVLETESYVDGKNHKSITTINGEKNYSVFDGDMIYTWSDKDMKGTKMSMKCMEDLKTKTEENPQASPSTLENIKANQEDFEDAMNVKCDPVGSVDLAVPSGIEFTDTCEMMKNSLEMMNKYKNQMPTQIPPGAIPEGINAQ